MPATAEQLKQARESVQWHLPTIEKGPDWPRPKPIKIPKASGVVAIDGCLESNEWARSACFDGQYPFNSSDLTNAPAMQWRVMWDVTNLYFGFECGDTDIQAPQTERDGSVFNNDSVEVFLMPDMDLGHYWEVVVSPSGCIFDGLHAKKFKGWGYTTAAGGKARNVEGLQIGGKIRGTCGKAGDRDEGYTVEIAVPFASLPTFGLGTVPAPGTRFFMMLCRIDKNGEQMQPYSFIPLLSWGHNIWNHVPAELAD